MDRYPDCAAPHCGRPAVGFSRYCNKHRGRAHRTGNPHGRILKTRLDLGEAFKLTDDALARYADHPAVIAAINWCDKVLSEAQTVRGNLGKELRRLYRDGATGKAMLRRILAVFCYAHFQQRNWTNDLLTVVNVGHHALLTTRLPRKRSARSGKLIATQFSGQTALEFGRAVREVLGMFCARFCERIERDLYAVEDAREAINAKLYENPL